MIGFPLLLIPLAIYNIFVFLMPGVAFTSPVATVTLMSGVVWTPTFGDALLALAIVLLLFEIVKASRPGSRYLTDHLLSLIVFVGAAAEFLWLAAFGTSTFFLLAVLAGVEFLAGGVIGLRNRKQKAAPAIAAPVRQEPSMASPPAGAKSPEPERPQPVPPSPPPVAETPKPIPTLAVTRASESPVQERKVSEWSMSDLVVDHEPDAQSDDAAQQPASSGTPPKP